MTEGDEEDRFLSFHNLPLRGFFQLPKSYCLKILHLSRLGTSSEIWQATLAFEYQEIPIMVGGFLKEFLLAILKLSPLST